MRIHPLLGSTLWISLLLLAAPVSAQPNSTGAELLADVPGLRHRESADRITYYGKPMLVGESPEARRSRVARALRGSPRRRRPRLVPTRSFDVHYGEFTVFWYKPTWKNVPSEEGKLVSWFGTTRTEAAWCTPRPIGFSYPTRSQKTGDIPRFDFVLKAR